LTKAVNYSKSITRPRACPVFAGSAQQTFAAAGKVRPLHLSPRLDALPLTTEYPLICHPACPCTGVDSLAVSLEWSADGTLILDYRLFGAPGRLRFPETQPAAPADNLWQHTCCELFVAEENGSGYREFNFSPSTQWAAYRFNSYRERDFSFAPPLAPQIDFLRLADGCRLAVRLPAAALPPGTCPRLGLNAVIEAADGSKSYWALAHGAGQPDFHQALNFALTPDPTHS